MEVNVPVEGFRISAQETVPTGGCVADVCVMEVKVPVEGFRTSAWETVLTGGCVAQMGALGSVRAVWHRRLCRCSLGSGGRWRLLLQDRQERWTRLLTNPPTCSGESDVIVEP